GEPVDRRQRGADPTRDEKTEGHRRIEVAARDEADGGHHHGDHEPVREGSDVDVPVDRRAGPDEDQREGADELGNRAARIIAIEHAPTIRAVPDGPAARNGGDDANVGVPGSSGSETWVSWTKKRPFFVPTTTSRPTRAWRLRGDENDPTQ